MIRKNLHSKNNSFMKIGILFLCSVLVGAFLNKFNFSYLSNLSGQVEGILNYYEGDISVLEVAKINLKEDMRYLLLIMLCSLSVVAFFISIGVFLIRALSIGYTINTCILLLKWKSLKICFLVFIKNLIIIPTGIILFAISVEYIKNVIKQLKKRNQESILFLGKRYLYNAGIVIILGIVLQLFLNIIIISILKFLSR